MFFLPASMLFACSFGVSYAGQKTGAVHVQSSEAQIVQDNTHAAEPYDFLQGKVLHAPLFKRTLSERTLSLLPDMLAIELPSPTFGFGMRPGHPKYGFVGLRMPVSLWWRDVLKWEVVLEPRWALWHFKRQSPHLEAAVQLQWPNQEDRQFRPYLRTGLYWNTWDWNLGISEEDGKAHVHDRTPFLEIAVEYLQHYYLGIRKIGQSKRRVLLPQESAAYQSENLPPYYAPGWTLFLGFKMPELHVWLKQRGD